ncbi:unnamed protein product [Fraxinus pennsylvanica]|uniref:Uncharacterized protein n=1 Tax=Fraxinus pennsylvanica TaxID=56036 RepID=A0AAD1YYV8_9LAMI|nr:unnamed protein product [Fraxinus pennsylvanica]
MNNPSSSPIETSETLPSTGNHAPSPVDSYNNLRATDDHLRIAPVVELPLATNIRRSNRNINLPNYLKDCNIITQNSKECEVYRVIADTNLIQAIFEFEVEEDKVVAGTGVGIIQSVEGRNIKVLY